MTVTISTPSRLHFGLLRFEQTSGPSFGGLGMMIAEPRTTVRMAVARAWQATGADGDRALAYAKLALDGLSSTIHEAPRAIRIDVEESIPAHHGLGSGTQLALAVAAGVRSLCGLAETSADELAAIAGRGRRSAIGCHGFTCGGMLYELGSFANEPLGRLARRVAAPSSWRIVLVTAARCAGLSGDHETKAFDRLPPVPAATTARLERLAEAAILPAAELENVKAFGEALFEYGRLAGECFVSVQGGPYASAEIAACVATLRELGVPGAGQSSWGPTVFAIVEDQSHAEALVARLRAIPRWAEHPMRITSADNNGAHIHRPANHGNHAAPSI